MIDADERAAMEETVRGRSRTPSRRGEAPNRCRPREARVAGDAPTTPDDAIGIVFGALGATNATATALDDVLASALGRSRAPTSPSSSAVRRWDAPGRSQGSDLHAPGSRPLAPPALASCW
jgi:hypothetical protein